jgi:hypothetical protein
MIRTAIFAGSIFLFLTSCTKTKDVHFHGRVMCCSQPVGNAVVSFIRYFDTGQENADMFGSTRTDNNGYFDVMINVPQKGLFDRYESFCSVSSSNTQRGVYGRGGEEYDLNDVEMSITARPNPIRVFSFNVKNINPININDIVNSLVVKQYVNTTVMVETLITNLEGSTIDTTFNYGRDDEEALYFLTTTKNGTATTISDTLPIPLCWDTLTIDLFY